MHYKGSLFSVSACLFPSVFPLPLLSLPFTSSSLFLFLPHPFLLKMGRRPALKLSPAHGELCAQSQGV